MHLKIGPTSSELGNAGPLFRPPPMLRSPHPAVSVKAYAHTETAGTAATPDRAQRGSGIKSRGRNATKTRPLGVIFELVRPHSFPPPESCPWSTRLYAYAGAAPLCPERTTPEPRAPDPRHSTRSRDEKKHIHQETGLTLRHRNSVTAVLSRFARTSSAAYHLPTGKRA